MNYYVYIITNWSNEVMYIGVTNNLKRRVYEHKNKLVEGFTKRYNVDKLLYFEVYKDVRLALNREKEIKGWRRAKKIALIEEKNPNYEDIYHLL